MASQRCPTPMVLAMGRVERDESSRRTSSYSRHASRRKRSNQQFAVTGSEQESKRRPATRWDARDGVSLGANRSEQLEQRGSARMRRVEPAGLGLGVQFANGGDGRIDVLGLHAGDCLDSFDDHLRGRQGV